MKRLRITARKKQGAILVDVMIAVFVTVLAALALFSMMPVVQRSQVMAAEETRANKIANRVIEHIQLLNPDDLNSNTLYSLNLIDADIGSPPYTFTNIPLDNASQYSPSTALKNGTGTMDVTDLSSGSKLVEITVTWTSSGGQTRSITTGTIVGGYRS